MNLVGILLAAGRGARFDPAARQSKLLAQRRSGSQAGQPLAAAAARTLRAALGTVLAVVRDAPDDDARQLRALLEDAGCTVLRWSPDAATAEGTGTSIACAVRASASADGWIVALADMPDIRPETIAAVRDAIAGGAASAAPFYRGQRGHPVGFGTACGAELAALTGDQGARAVLERHPPVRIDVDDPGILFDVDRREDL